MYKRQLPYDLKLTFLRSCRFGQSAHAGRGIHATEQRCLGGLRVTTRCIVTVQLLTDAAQLRRRHTNIGVQRGAPRDLLDGTLQRVETCAGLCHQRIGRQHHTLQLLRVTQVRDGALAFGDRDGMVGQQRDVERRRLRQRGAYALYPLEELHAVGARRDIRPVAAECAAAASTTFTAAAATTTCLLYTSPSPRD